MYCTIFVIQTIHSITYRLEKKAFDLILSIIDRCFFVPIDKRYHEISIIHILG
jgi:hypothetical protein